MRGFHCKKQVMNHSHRSPRLQLSLLLGKKVTFNMLIAKNCRPIKTIGVTELTNLWRVQNSPLGFSLSPSLWFLASLSLVCLFSGWPGLLPSSFQYNNYSPALHLWLIISPAFHFKRLGHTSIFTNLLINPPC